MAEIQFYPKELDYVSEKLGHAEGSNSFMEYFLKACLRADYQNYELLRPVLTELMKVYPL